MTIVVSFSGGKDSTATALLALDEVARGADVRVVFADTQWARTSRGGKQFTLLNLDEPRECSSVYGLCE